MLKMELTSTPNTPIQWNLRDEQKKIIRMIDDALPICTMTEPPPTSLSISIIIDEMLGTAARPSNASTTMPSNMHNECCCNQPIFHDHGPTALQIPWWQISSSIQSLVGGHIALRSAIVLNGIQEQETLARRHRWD